MEKTEKTRKEIIEIIEDAAENAGEGEYSKARAKIGEAMQKTYPVDAKVHYWLNDIKETIKTIPEPNKKDSLSKNMKEWILSVSDILR